jgi:dTDP-4-amino-4,6-dideoxygalactose transaminase
MILMNDFKAEPPELRQAMLSAAERVLASGWYVLGREVEAFERTWAATCGTGYGVGVGNGLDAIETALRAAGIGAGDEVITTPMTAFATALAIIRAGATPVLADIDPDTALLSIDSARRCLSSRTRALVLVHLYGQVRQMDAWIGLCQEAGIALIEDCAQAHLASSQGRVAGSMGRAGAYSFYPTKNLGGIGDGGMVVTQDAELAGLAAQLRNYGQSERYYHPHLGLNSRLDELQAALLAERLRWLPEFTARRREIAEAYYSGINNPLIKQLAKPEEDSAHVYHLYVVACEYRDRLQTYLKEQGIQTLIHYPVPIHRQACVQHWHIDPLGLPHTEKHAATCLSLPCHPQMTDEDIAAVIHSVNAFKHAG